MPAKAGSKQPKYRLHKPSGQAAVTLVDALTKRRVVKYLGAYDTPESRERYHNVIGRWEANGRRLDEPRPEEPRTAGNVTVRDVLNGYKAHITPLRSPGRAEAITRALDLAINHRPDEHGAAYGDTSANTFGPVKLEQVRFTMVGLGWTRDKINTEIRAVVKAFRWAASKQMIKADVYVQLATLSNLERGEVAVPEVGSVPAAPDDDIEEAIPHMPTPVQAMVRLQLLTGMRPNEVCIMRAVDITVASDEVWYYEPAHHKTEYANKKRRVRLGPRCIEIVRPLMQGLRPDDYLFDPRKANAEGKARNAKGRRRSDQKPNRTKTQRVIGERYTKDSYRQAVQRACKKAEVPKISPRQFRKNALTRIERAHGLEIAAKLADHSEATTTAKHYLQRDDAMLDRVAVESA